MSKLSSFLQNILLLAAAIIFTIPVAISQTIVPAEMPVSYDVSPAGAFTYSLPIEIPPGIKDVMPSLAISYNSQGGNSTLGVGWAVGGISSITRGKPTIFHNQKLNPVNFNADDVFMLDGQRLFETSTGVYMTEIKNFAKIESHGTAGNGPDYFTVEYPNGILYTYGATTPSKMLAQGKSDVLTWAISSITDRNGNYIAFDYYNDQSTGQYRITKISYAGNTNASVTPHTDIVFRYEIRPDNNMTWFSNFASTGSAASIVQDNHRLTGIDIKQDSVLINEYDFTYDLNQYSHLKTITQKRPDQNAELPVININWGKEDLGVSPQNDIKATVNVASQQMNDHSYTMGDFNGDGATDFVMLHNTSTLNGIEVYFSDKQNDFDYQYSASHTFQYTDVYKQESNNSRSTRFSFDYNGDGYDDVIIKEKSTNSQGFWCLRFHLYLSTGNSFNYSGIILEYVDLFLGTGGVFIDQTKILAGNFDGDGKRDFILLMPDQISSGKGVSYDVVILGHAYPNGGLNYFIGGGQITYGEYRPVGHIGYEIDNAMALEYDGDGKDEFMIVTDHHGYLSHNTEIYQLTPTYYGADVIASPGSITRIHCDNFPSPDHRVWVGDFNGDGKTDLLTWLPSSQTTVGSVGQWEIVYSTGATGVPTSSSGWQWANYPLPVQPNELFNTGPWFLPKWHYEIADFNGDGKDDILQIQDNTGTQTWNSMVRPNPANNTCNIYYSLGGDRFEKVFQQLPDSLKVYEGHHLGDFNGDGQLDLMHDGPFTSQPFIVYFRKNDISQIVTSIEHAGKRLDINYNSLAEHGAPYEFVPWSKGSHTQTEYPYISRQIPMKVVIGLKDNISLDNTYRYETLSIHLTGLGLQGFHKTYIKDVTSNRLAENEFTLLPWAVAGGHYGRIPMPVKSSVYTLNTSGQISNTISTRDINSTDIAGDPSGIVRIIKQHDIVEANYAAGTYRNTYHGFNFSGPMCYDFGLPDSTYEDFGVHNGYNNVITYYTYDATAPFYNKSKPISVTKKRTYASKTPDSRTTEYQYNTQGLLSQQKTDPGTANENTIVYTHDAFGNSTSITRSATGLPTVVNDYEYSSDGRLQIKSKSYLGSNTYVDSNAYNKWGALLYYRGANGLVTEYEYDPINRLLTTKTPDGVVTHTNYGWAYDNPANNPPSSFTHYTNITSNQGAARFCLRKTTDGITGASYEFYDFYQRKLRDVYPAFDGSSIYKDAIYNVKGELYQVKSHYPKTNPGLAVTTTFTYNDFGMEVQRSSSSGPTITTQYQASVLPAFIKTTVTNTSTTPQQVKITYSDDGGVYQVDDNGNSIATDYNSNGQPDYTMLNADINLKTTFTYDFGRVLTKTEPNCGTTTYTYDAYGELLTEEDAIGTKSTYTYDDLGKLLQKKYEDASSNINYTNYLYQDASGLGHTGKLTHISSDFGTGSDVDYEYDPLGRVERVTETPNPHSPLVTEYTYDNFGKVATHKYPSNNVIQNNYNQYGFLKSIEVLSSPGSPLMPQKLWEINSKNHLGQTTEAEYYNAANTASYTINRSYDIVGFNTERKLTANGGMLGTVISRFEYDFDHNTGNLNYRKDKLRSLDENFTYDEFDRLRTASNNTVSPNVPVFFEYDNVGNTRKKSDITSSTYNWRYDKYALLTVPDNAGGTDLAAVRQPNTQDVEYYPFKKVKTISEVQNLMIFNYGPEEQRNMVEYYTLPGPTLVKQRFYATNYEETHVAGTPPNQLETIDYIYAEGEPIAMLYKGAMSTQSEIYYFFTDHLGSITHILNANGSGINGGIVEERSFDAWGRPRDPNTWQYFAPGTPPNWMIDRGYTGHEHVWLNNTYDNNIINMNGRLYDPLVGRMFSPDPVMGDNASSQAYNKYSYCQNNPLKYTDPTGEFIFSILLPGIGTFIDAACWGAVIGGAGYTASVAMSPGGFSNWNSSQFWTSVGAGALSGVATAGIGQIFGAVGSGGLGGEVIRGMAHGASNGIISGVTGGDAISGALSGTLGSWAGSGFQSTFGNNELGIYAFSALSGGVGAELSGGNFWQGAAIGTINAAFNHLQHQFSHAQLKRLFEIYQKSVENYDNGAAFYASIGGPLGAEAAKKPQDYVNTCAARLSKALNYGGFPIPKGYPGTMLGADGKSYFIKAIEMKTYLEKRVWGIPDNKIKPKDLRNGVFFQNGFEHATGHLDIMCEGRVAHDIYVDKPLFVWH